MKQEFIPYEQALALKELGFDEQTLGYYQFKILKIQPPILKKENQNQYFMRAEDCSAPLYQQAFRWFREPKNGSHNHLDFMYEYLKDDSVSYEEAELACLKKLIEYKQTFKKNKI